jgi:hypothetical protein
VEEVDRPLMNTRIRVIALASGKRGYNQIEDMRAVCDGEKCDIYARIPGAFRRFDNGQRELDE